MGEYDRLKIKWTKTIANLLGIIAGVALIVGTTFMVINIFIRPFGLAMRYIYDLAGLSAAFAASLAIPYCALLQDHTVMDLVLGKMPAGMRKISESISGIISIGIIFLLIYAGGKYAYTKTLVFEKTLSGNLPTWIFRWVWVLGMVLLACAIIIETIDFVRLAMGKQVFTIFDEEDSSVVLLGGEEQNHD